VRRQEQELGELDRHFLGLADELGAANKNLTGEVDQSYCQYLWIKIF